MFQSYFIRKVLGNVEEEIFNLFAYKLTINYEIFVN